jgi:hypothetical protein
MIRVRSNPTPITRRLTATAARRLRPYAGRDRMLRVWRPTGATRLTAARRIRLTSAAPNATGRTTAPNINFEVTA